jgi:CRP-like cAMP-binding protein
MPNDVVNKGVFSDNYLLRSLADEAFARLRPHLERVSLETGQVLAQPSDKMEHVYFPAGSMISLLASTPDGRSIEVAMIGNEGAAGISVVMGSDTTVHEHVVRLSGNAWRLRSTAVVDEFERGTEFQHAVLAFVRQRAIQIGQTALCNRFFPIEKRLSRWLLMCHDRSGTAVLPITQESIGKVLGVSRVRVTLAALRLQELGLIKTGRAKITISDREALEGFTCSCYFTIKEAYDKQLN